jgi:hypothetical protein
MGAGILPATIVKGELTFLFGKENQYEDSAHGFSDFGGGTDNQETYLETAIREGGEELTGFLGTDKELEKLLKKHGTYNIDHHSNSHSTYRMHIFPIEYDPMLPFYYNNNQKFIQKRLDPHIIQESKIFEKAEIRWVPMHDLQKMRGHFRPYFRNIVDQICSQQKEINKFIRTGLKKSTKKNVTRKRK